MSVKVAVAGATAAAAASVLPELVADKVASRIAAKDFTLWGKDAEAESSIRLGWVNSAVDTAAVVERVIALRQEFLTKGVDRFVLCGMGGSSLAPEVITRTAGVHLVVLDSTNPDQVAAAVNEAIERTAIVVSSKSGSTVETDSQKRAFEAAFTAAGIDKTDRIVIVTDPGSPMEQAALADGYRVFNADPTVGGRYSALTAFGIVPSGLAGVDVAALLADGHSVAAQLASDDETNPGLILGAALARTANGAGFKDKVGIVTGDTDIVGFGDWAEQLIAESTGKLGKGVLPVVLATDSPEVSANQADVVLARIVKDAASAADGEIAVSGSLGAQFVLWEYATVVASRLIGINPFDQPDVESAKIAARGMLENRPEIVTTDFVDGAVEVRGQNVEFGADHSVAGALAAVLSKLDAAEGYVSIHAYLDRNNAAAAEELRDALAARTGRPVTFGWAPRFLHSTGQYHKGGPRQGVYIQLVAQAEADLAVPGRPFTFGQLIASQAAGDGSVLAALGLPVLNLTLTDVAAGLAAINGASA